MNERVKELRQALCLSGEKFGEAIGVKRSAISDIETGRNNLTEQMIKSICLAYNVNENWLRTGEGSMFNRTKESFLAELQKQFSLSDLQVNLIKTYIELSDKDRASIDKFITFFLENANDKKV